MTKSVVAGLLIVFVAIGVPVPVAAQQNYQPPKGATPRTASGRVDFSGGWEKPYVPDLTKEWFGDSVGHWEGDTLVIDTINVNGRTRLDTIGHPHSDQLHLVQRFSRPDLGHISHEMIIEDPKAYTKPWKTTRIFTLRTDWEMMEYSCEENNKSLWEGRIKIPKR